MEEHEVDIFSKAPDWKSFLLLKITIKQNPECANKEYNTIFEHPPEYEGISQKLKKFCINKKL